jgi:lipoate-protein ligase A
MTMNSATRYLLLTGPGDYAFNMALDEALLEAMPRLAVPVLRFYGWTEPAASFGYFQKHTDVQRLTSLRPLVRRPTGGGVVPHDADWTYSVAFPPTDDWYALKAKASYRRVHAWIQAAFAKVGVTTELAPASSKAMPGQCFAGYEQSDVLCQGRKIAGAAQRRTRDGLLIQGSVQPPAAGLARADWERAMCKVARVEHGIQWVEFAPDAALEKRAEELARQKYSQAAYNRKR